MSLPSWLVPDGIEIWIREAEEPVEHLRRFITSGLHAVSMAFENDDQGHRCALRIHKCCIASSFALAFLQILLTWFAFTWSISVKAFWIVLGSLVLVSQMAWLQVLFTRMRASSDLKEYQRRRAKGDLVEHCNHWAFFRANAGLFVADDQVSRV